MEPAHTHDTAARWARFAANETPKHSPVMQTWAAAAADDAEIMALVATLPPRERQPNLVLAAARLVDPGLVSPDQREPRPDEYARLRRTLLTHWREIAAVTAARHTQTNEAGRLAVMLPALWHLHTTTGRELALIELGASAGLALHPQAWHFRYLDREGRPLASLAGLQPCEPARPRLDVIVKDALPLPLPTALPPIMWRLGVDLHPLNPLNPDDAAWLRTLVWPGQTERLARLDHALDAARHDPVLVLGKDITGPDVIDEVLRLVPRDYLPVVCHGAVLAYLEEDARKHLVSDLRQAVDAGELHWLSNEGHAVVPGVTHSNPRRGAFTVALDGQPLYQADGHASWLAP